MIGSIPPQIMVKPSSGNYIPHMASSEDLQNCMPELKMTGKSKSTDLPKVTLAKVKQDTQNRSAADSVIARLGTLRMTQSRRERVILNQKEIS